MDVVKILPLAATAAIALTTTMIAPRLVPQAAGNVWIKYGVQAAVAVGGGMAIRATRMLNNQHAAVWTVTGFAVIVGDLLNTYVLPRLGIGVGDYTVEDYAVVHGDDEISAFPGDVGAFPFTSNEYETQSY